MCLGLIEINVTMAVCVAFHYFLNNEINNHLIFINHLKNLNHYLVNNHYLEYDFNH